MKVLVLGGYGLIGAEVVRQLHDAGHSVVGLGRNTVQAARRFPEVLWIAADLAHLNRDSAWEPILRQTAPDAIVNCAGVLQDGVRDDVVRVQATAMRALYVAALALGVRRFVQISAAGANLHSPLMFLRSKGEADQALQASTLDWVILRPGLVIGPQAYGGTALLRALAVVPMVQPVAYADSRVQTVAAGDVAAAVVLALGDRVPMRRVYDLVEDEAHRLADVLRLLRGWLGHAPGREVRLPEMVVRLAARVADGLGWLGWRPPMRTTAMAVLAAGVAGDPGPWREASGQSLASLRDTLRRMPATVQERWFARMFLLKPAAIFALSVFWLVSGLVALANPHSAASVLTSRGGNESLALAAVLGGAVADIGLGALILWRDWMPTAAHGMVAVTIVYLIGGTLLAPDLWIDPLGPLVKTIPAALLALIVAALAEDR